MTPEVKIDICKNSGQRAGQWAWKYLTSTTDGAKVCGTVFLTWLYQARSTGDLMYQRKNKNYDKAQYECRTAFINATVNRLLNDPEAIEVCALLFAIMKGNDVSQSARVLATDVKDNLVKQYQDNWQAKDNLPSHMSPLLKDMHTDGPISTLMDINRAKIGLGL